MDAPISMRFPFALLLAIPVVTLAGPALAAEVTVESGAGRVHLLELFTSEGCSCCPPAEKWFSTLRQSPRLWKEVVPVAFHVDYWDYLGWRDPLASQAATERQRAYAASWRTAGVYTPGFVLDGQEWRAASLDRLPASPVGPGKLSAILHANGDVQMSFQPAARTASQWVAHAALLGYGIVLDVKAGENNGRRLIHDFAVLPLQASEMPGNSPAATLHLPSDKVKHQQTALAVWVTESGKLVPVQAAGGEL